MCIHYQLSMQEITTISIYIPTLQIIYSIADHIVLRIRRFTSKLATLSFQQHAASITQLWSRYPNRMRLVCGLVCAMHTLHTLKLEFVKRFQTPTAVKFSARICHTLLQCHYIFILIRKK